MSDDIWALWPDGCMCPKEELAEYLEWRSDDYELVEVLDYEDYEPSVWQKLL